MKVLCLGSLNLDYVYSVPHFVQMGETLACNTRNEFCGGKGLNQSIALAKAGAQVYHAGKIGPEGSVLRKALEDAGVNTDFLTTVPSPSGHAIIQVDSSGQNSIIIYGGANQQITPENVDQVLSHFSAGDILLLQNETSSRDYAIAAAAAKGMQVALNPSPIDENLKNSPELKRVHWFILNEIEGNELCGLTEPQAIVQRLNEMHPGSIIVLTQGRNGVLYYDGTQTLYQPIFRVPTVDTTAAGDTFTGFFLAGIASGDTPVKALRTASKASAIAVSKAGAAQSIPTLQQVIESPICETQI